MNISNKNETLHILKKYGFQFKKSLGQNFLIEQNILDKIVKVAEIDSNTGVIEIGPGIGALTQKLAQRAGKVVSVEIDQRLLPILNETMSEYNNAEIIHGDVLKISLKEVIENNLSDFKKIKLVANLPYYVTTPIIMSILEDKLEIDSITIMVQREVAERISATPGGKEYGSLTLMVNYFAEASIAFYVPSTVFIPKPNVDSAVLQLKIRKEPPMYVDNEDLLFKMIKASFAQRRKTINNNLLNNLVGKENKGMLNDLFRTLNIDSNRRAETFSLEEFVNLSNSLHKIEKMY